MFACIIIFALIQISNSLKCYACVSCNDPFIIYNPPILNLPDNEGFNCTKEHTMSGVNRGATKSCNSNNMDEWCCPSDLCNDSVKLASMNFIYFIVILEIAINFF